jgi:signal peptidase I
MMRGEQRPGENENADSPARTDAAGKKKPKKWPFWIELPVLVVAGLAITLVIKTFAVEAFYIPSSSMENTLKINDMVLVSKLVYHFRSIARGDIVVFDGEGSWEPEPPVTTSSNPVARVYGATLRPLLRSIAGLFGTAPGPADFVKRVIGVPGDHVACCTARGLITVNGVPLRETSYLYPGDASGSAPAGISGSFSITVPPGRLWVMGDHRSVSDDSRLRRGDPGGGTIPENKVVGRALAIVWPPSRWRILPIPSTFSRRGINSPGAYAGISAAMAPAVPYLPLVAGFALAFPLTGCLRLRARNGAGVIRARRGLDAAPPAAAAAPPGSSRAGPLDNPRTP